MESLWDAASRIRKDPKGKYDQLFATKKTVEERIGVLMDHEDIERRRILMVGDDDLLSMAIMDAAKKRHVPIEVCVVDIDEELLTIFYRLTRGAVKTWVYDVRKPLPADLKSRFDVVFTDPPYTVDGQAMFLSRARAALKRKPSSVCYSCYSTKDLRPKSIVKVQRVMNDMGFAIENIWPEFNTYEDAKRRKSEKAIQHFHSNLLRSKFVPGAGRKRVLVGKRIYRYD